ncbi:MAG: DMT family transporter [Candidatus Kapaibacteriales bacterium]
MIYLILVFIQLIASTTHIFGKVLTNELNPSIVLFFRALFASIFFIIILFIRKENLSNLEKKDILPFIFIGILNIPLNQFLFFTSIKLTTPSNVALAYALAPVFIMFFAKTILQEEFRLLRLIGVVLAFVGIVIILIENGISLNSKNFLGNFIALLATLSWAIYSVYSKPLITKYGSIFSTAVAMIFGFLFYLPIALLQNSLAEVSQIRTTHWLEILYLAIMTSGIVYLLWFYAIKRLPVSKVGVFQNLQPIFTTILAIIIFDQQITREYLYGGLLVIFGVFLTQRS